MYVAVRMGEFPIYCSGDASSLSYHQDIQEGDLPINLLFLRELDRWVLRVKVVME